MILRKPYAFLIKHFKMINLFLLVLIIFSLRNVLNLYTFTKEYVTTGVYSVNLVPISDYINLFSNLALIFIIVFSSILTYLLLKKDKPIITYIYIIITAILTLILSSYINNLFVYTIPNNGYDGQIARLIRDLVFINSFFFYPIIVVLIIRSLGIDLNSFGFYQDNEFISTNEEDREEVEVEVKFDKYKYIRLFKNKYRTLKYFVLEHLYTIIPIVFLVVAIASYSTYKVIFVENKVYKQGEGLVSNNYKITINNSYLTDKDYAGNTISSKNRYFIVIDATIYNYVYERMFDINKLVLFVDNESYVPTVRYNNSFKDLGNTYVKGNTLARNQSKNYMFVYEIEKPSENANFLLKYQDMGSKDKKMIRFKLKVLDISDFKERDTVNIDNEINIPVNSDLAYKFSLSNLTITDTKKYTYESCSGYNCPIIESELVASNNKKILYLKLDSETSVYDFLSFLYKYGKIKYTVDGKEYVEEISIKTKKYRGSHIYLEVPSNIEKADTITLMFTIRTNQYFYILRGENNDN